MGNDDMWNNLPGDIMIVIAQKLDLPGNIRLSAVSRSWKSATSILEVPPSKCPCLLLAEDTGAAHTVTDDDDDNHFSDDEDSSDDDSDDDGNYHDFHGGEHIHNVVIDGDGDNYEVNDEGIDQVDDDHKVVNEGIDNNDMVDNRDVISNETNKVEEVNSDTHINTRGLFCLSTGKTYIIDLPQASGKVILGTNKGWLLTLGRDSEINLLHPFSKHQVTLPTMLTFATQIVYLDGFAPERAFKAFISKVAISSTVATSGDNNHPIPVIMAIYGPYRMLAFARLGDKIWTDVKTDSGCFEDVVYHKDKFYAVTNSEVHMCEIDDDDDDKKGDLDVQKLQHFH